MKIESIYIYPIKSLPGISLDQVEITKNGLKYDRVFCLIKDDENDPKKKWISLRTNPELVKFRLSISDSILKVSHKDHVDSITIDLDRSYNSALSEIDIWDDKITIKSIYGNVSDYFSKILGFKVFLGIFSSRTISRKRYNDFIACPMLNDGFPISLGSTESLKKINEQLEESIGIDRFRLNLVVSGLEPFSEDKLKKVYTTDILLNVKESIPRCVVTMVDNITGDIRKDQNILVVLNKLNRIGRPDDFSKMKPRFGLGVFPTIESVGNKISREDEFKC